MSFLYVVYVAQVFSLLEWLGFPMFYGSGILQVVRTIFETLSGFLFFGICNVLQGRAVSQV